jgi:hypothetical protein
MIIVMVEKFAQIPPLIRDNKRDFVPLPPPPPAAAVVVDDPNFDRKLDLITAGANPYLKEHLLTKIPKENCLVIIAYNMM